MWAVGVRKSGQLCIRAVEIVNDCVTVGGDPLVEVFRINPQLLAIALVIRHSWNPQDLARITRRLGLSLQPPSRSITRANDRTHAAAVTAAASRPPRRSQSSKA